MGCLQNTQKVEHIGPTVLRVDHWGENYLLNNRMPKETAVPAYRVLPARELLLLVIKSHCAIILSPFLNRSALIEHRRNSGERRNGGKGGNTPSDFPMHSPFLCSMHCRSLKYGHSTD